eukprot:CAMPEP_0168411044 /NCGR_PEP_ID=MMETSP0228-20121227/28002_1 /TAXON_ID=133427 /ORGANISM="Protoceratium reticulatum, Strain CCCM 535 (=CCMP 1889)" /LENGTH=260 /DNA_ID=CAMNT_0008424787 /DNA_START=92 /DNA_END=871 /DNA_ORIENTATION=+
MTVGQRSTMHSRAMRFTCDRALKGHVNSCPDVFARSPDVHTNVLLAHPAGAYAVDGQVARRERKDQLLALSGLQQARLLEPAEHPRGLAGLRAELHVGLGDFRAGAHTAVGHVDRDAGRARRRACPPCGVVVAEARVREAVAEGEGRPQRWRPVGGEEPLRVADPAPAGLDRVTGRGRQGDGQLGARGHVPEEHRGPGAARALAREEETGDGGDALAPGRQHRAGRLHQHDRALGHCGDGGDELVGVVVQGEGGPVGALT